ncbi:MAG: AAA family ATPase [Alphaproteobacteria bacterium]|nr:AAA family ATPase [Alphaproteobacteria bacterium]
MQAVITNKKISLDDIKNDISARMDTAAFRSWISPLSFEVRDNVLVLGAHNQFTADFVNSTHLNILRSVAGAYGLDVCVVVNNLQKSVLVNQNANDNNIQSYYAPITDVPLTGFDAFISSEENAFVVSACKKMAAGSASFSPLFIYGPAGCGKTLLASAIRSESAGRVVMMSGAQFVSEFARALHDRTIFSFKDYCRNCDTFILDDVQVLSGKRATCDEFLQLILDLRDAGKNIVLTANGAPSNLSGFDYRAQSLFASGLVADIVAPSRSVRRSMFVRAGVSGAVADMLSGRILADGHVISGVLNKINTYRELMGASIDVDIAERLLADTLKKSKSPMVMVKSMCEKLGVSYDAVCGNGRSRSLVLARQMMMVVLKSVTGLSLTQIGDYVGGRDHATVLYGIERIEKLEKSDLVLSAQLNQMIEEYK